MWKPYDNHKYSLKKSAQVCFCFAVTVSCLAPPPTDTHSMFLNNMSQLFMTHLLSHHVLREAFWSASRCSIYWKRRSSAEFQKNNSNLTSHERDAFLLLLQQNTLLLQVSVKATFNDETVTESWKESCRKAPIRQQKQQSVSQSVCLIMGGLHTDTLINKLILKNKKRRNLTNKNN